MPLTWQQLLEKVKKEIQEITTDDLYREVNNNDKIAIVDVREHDEFIKGHLPGAIFIPRGFLELRIENTIPDRDEKIYLYCGGGNRSVLAARSLQEMGYKRVASLKGGFAQWSKEAKPIEFPREQDTEG
jgi:sulfur-carrier protein adenylyltransferase/sulfurtransferase